MAPIYRSLILLLGSLLPILAEASFTDPIDGKFDMGDYLAENAYGFLPVPIIITEPSVGYGGGLAGLFLHETEAEKNQRQQQALASYDGGAHLMTPNMTAVALAGTENGTWFAGALHRRSWFKDSIRYMAAGGVGQGNINLYTDFGGQLPQDQAFRFDTKTRFAGLFQKAQFRVKDSNWLLGARQVLSTSTLTSSNRVVDKTFDLLGLDQTNTSGLGLVVEYDSRNNLFFPTKGYSLTADRTWYRQALGGDYDYDKSSVGGRAYFPLNEQWILALAGNYDAMDSHDQLLPPTLKPYVSLRGVSAFRYQGDQVVTGQAQLMYRLDTRWTLLGFYGRGITSNENLSLGNCPTGCEIISSSSSSSVDAYGGGFRYQIARRYGLHMGMDFGFSAEESAFYFTVGTGF